MLASETENEKFESGKTHFKTQTTEFVKNCYLNIKVYCIRDSAVITTGSGNVTLKRGRSSEQKGNISHFRKLQAQNGVGMDSRFYSALIVLYNGNPRLTVCSDIAVEWLAILSIREVLSLIMDPKTCYSISGFQ
jgi:hypothetical protein